MKLYFHIFVVQLFIYLYILTFEIIPLITDI